MDEFADALDGRDILISIVNYRTAAHCVSCLASLASEREAFGGFRVVVADGASGDGSVEALENWVRDNGHGDWISVLPLSRNGGFGWAHNQIMLRALQADNSPRFIHLLNPDTILESGAVEALRRAFDRIPKAGCVGSQMINKEGGLQPAGFRLPGIRNEFARGAGASGLAEILGARKTVIQGGKNLREVEAVSGASFMIRTAALREVGLFDTGFFLYFEEFEWMKRFRAHGWTITLAPDSRVHHVGGAATKLSRDREVLNKSARPFYWYQSQRRFIYRTLGSIRARLAGLAWFSGYALIALPQAAFSPDFRLRRVKGEARDMLRAWLTSERFDQRAFVDFPGDPINQPPAWQERQK